MLRIVEDKDAEGMLEWMHDKDIMHSFRFDGDDMDLHKVKEFIREAVKLAEQGTTYHFAIVNKKDEYMGTVSLKHIDNVNKNAEYAICLRKVAQGMGYAEQATRDLLRFAFNELKLTRVYLNVFSDNVRAKNFYEKLGFQYEGQWRKCLHIHDEFKNLYWYAMLKEDYNTLEKNGNE